MKKKAILWVHGGIGQKKKVNFEYNEKMLYSIISPTALKEYYSKTQEGIDLITFVPHSIYLNEGQLEKEIMKEEIKDFEEIPLPSIGRLRIGEKVYSFNGDYNYIKFWVFINLLRIYFQNKYEVFYCDISQGLNIYMDAFKEAFKNLVVFDKLRNMSEESIKVHILYSDPILYGVENPRIYDDVELRVKAFFDSPIGKPDEKFASIHLLDAEAERVLKNFYRTFRAVRYNAPGVVLTFGYDSHEKIAEVVKKLMEKYLHIYDPGQFQEYKTNYEYPLIERAEEKTAIFLALALYENMAKALKREGIPSDRKREFSIYDMSRFLKVYLHYGLRVSADMLERDIKKYASLEAPADWVLIGYPINKNKFIPRKLEDLSRDPDAKRNFFAHSGVENNLVMVKKAENGQVVFKYREDAYSLIENFLYE